MTRLGLLVFLLAVVACDEDPARSVKIAARPVPPPAPTGGSPGVPDWEWRPDLCPPPAEPPGGPSALVAAGACDFRHEGAVACTSALDDFILEASRPAARGATLTIYLNVEKYQGPGRYDEAQMLVTVQDAAGVFRWRSDTVFVTVGEGEKFAELEPTRLESLPPMDESVITVSGRLVCRPGTGGA